MDRKNLLLKWILWIVFVMLPLVAQFGMLDANTYQDSRRKLFNWEQPTLSHSSEITQLNPIAEKEFSQELLDEKHMHFIGRLSSIQLSQIDKKHISSIYNQTVSFIYNPITGNEDRLDQSDVLLFQELQIDVPATFTDIESMQLAYDAFIPPISAAWIDFGSINNSKPQPVPTELQFRKYVWAESTLLQFNQPSIVEKGYIASGEDGKSLRYDSIINKVAERHNVDPALIKAIITVESYFNHKAESHRGAKGLMQLMPRTAEDLGVTDILDPEQNIDAGARYYKWLLKRVKGKRDLALAAYNAGIKRVMDYRGIPPFAETRAYVIKVQQYYEKYKDKPKRS